MQKNSLFAELLAEFIGTTVLLLFGLGFLTHNKYVQLIGAALRSVFFSSGVSTPLSESEGYT